MASGVSDRGAGLWLSALFCITDPIAGYWVGLCAGDPGAAADGDVVLTLEPGADDDDRRTCGYTRRWIPAGPDAWAADDAYLTNLVEIAFPLPATDWGYLSHYALLDTPSDFSDTPDGGQLYAWGAFANPQTVTTSTAMTIPVGGLVLSLSSVEDSIAV